ncbi:MAG: hypothetical protein AAB474_02345 [Patescibacteria group bacterium]
MNEKTESKNQKPSSPSTSKTLGRIFIFALSLAILFLIASTFNLYSEFRRQWMCNQMSREITVKNFQAIQSSQFDINNYILQKEAFENACLKRTGFGSYFWFFASLWFLFWFPGYAVTLFGKYPESIKKGDKTRF